jgi:hypothetical protein
MQSPQQTNPRVDILRGEAEREILEQFRKHGWSATIVHENSHRDSLEIAAEKCGKAVRIGVLYTTSTDNAHYRELEQRVEHIFFHGGSYLLEQYAHGIHIPVEPISDFFPYLVSLNRQVEPDRSPKIRRSPTLAVRRITDENPLESVLTRLQQFTSVHLAAQLVMRRAVHENVDLTPECVSSKAAGIAFAMRNALDYFSLSPADRLNKRVLGLYYGTMAFGFAEMLASPSGPSDLDEVEAMTKQGHGMYAIDGPSGSFADLHVGVLASGFLPRWLAFLGHDTSAFSKKKPGTASDIGTVLPGMICTLESLFSSMPEIDDLFAEVFGGAPGWIVPVYDQMSNHRASLHGTNKVVESTYSLFVDRSGLIAAERLQSAGWPLAEIRLLEDAKGLGNTYRARIDHTGHRSFWDVLPTHASPFGNRTTLLFPALGGMTEYRTIAATTLYALSIMVRYMPSSWRRIEGGDEDQYLALVKASLRAWERVLPQEFLQSIAGEKVVTTQPDSWLS